MTLFKGYIACWKRYAEFTGRARRKEYWGFYLYSLFFMLLWAIIGGIISFAASDGNIEMVMITVFAPIMLYLISVIIPAASSTVRRLHDVNKSAWWLLVFLIPTIGQLVIFIFTLLDSHPTANKWGDNPKKPYSTPSSDFSVANQQYFYIDTNQQQQGPVAVNELIKFGVSRNTMVWKQGMNNWQPVGTLPELAGMFPPINQF